MEDIVQLLKTERKNMYDVLLKNSVKMEIQTGYCPDCKHEEHIIQHKEEYEEPKPVSIMDNHNETECIVQHPHIENETIVTEPLFL